MRRQKTREDFRIERGLGGLAAIQEAKKAELEKRIDKMKPRVNRIVRKILPKVRKAAHGG